MIAPQDKETSAPERRSGRIMIAANMIAGLLVLSLVALMVSPAPAGKVATVTRIPTMTLSNGVEYPLIASNTADLTAEQTDIALRVAVLAGIKNVDFHDNDEINGVAKAIKAMGRDAFFLATKINKPPPDMSDPAAAKALAQKQFDDNMAVLGVDFLDTLMLKDSPYCEVMQAQWEVVEDLYAKGRARSIGVYNLCEKSLACVLETAKVKPMIHYIMRHVGMGADTDGLIAFGESHGLAHAVYGSLGEPIALPELLSNTNLLQIAKAHGRTPEEVAVKWNLQSGYAVDLRLNSNYGPSNAATMPTASYCTNNCVVTITAMTQMFDWSLTEGDMIALNYIIFNNFPQSPTYYSSGGCPNSFGATIALADKTSSCPSSGSTWC